MGTRGLSWPLGIAFLASVLVAASGVAQENELGNRPRDQRRRPRPEEENALKTGQLAPTFTLQSLAGDETFDLRTSRGHRPVVLIFGSYT